MRASKSDRLKAHMFLGKHRWVQAIRPGPNHTAVCVCKDCHLMAVKDQYGLSISGTTKYSDGWKGARKDRLLTMMRRHNDTLKFLRDNNLDTKP